VVPLFKEICLYFTDLPVIDNLNKNVKQIKKKIESMTPKS
jgi:hypothetical protein